MRCRLIATEIKLVCFYLCCWGLSWKPVFGLGSFLSSGEASADCLVNVTNTATLRINPLHALNTMDVYAAAVAASHFKVSALTPLKLDLSDPQ